MISSAQFTSDADVFAWCASPNSLSTVILNNNEPTFSLVRCSDPLDRTRTIGDDAQTKCLFVEPQASTSSLIAIVPALSPPVVVRLFDVRQSKRLIDLSFPSAVRAVRLNMKRLVVILEDSVHIFDTETLRRLHKFEAPRRLATDCCALSSNCILALPAARVGSVLLFDVLNLRVVQVIPAHQTIITCLTLSDDGQILATASETGTLVRLFSVTTGEKRAIFRRGSYSARVTCLCFSPSQQDQQHRDPEYIAVGSDNGTVHVFEITNQTSSSSYASLVTGGVSVLTTWLPSSVSDIVEPSRCTALARTYSGPLACAFYYAHPRLCLLRVVTIDGYFREFILLDDSGKISSFELELKRQVRLLETSLDEEDNQECEENQHEEDEDES